MNPADRVFGGRYRIVGEVGRGGMGVIFRGVDSVLDREVAIKVMSGDFAETTDEQRARFFREAKAAARLQHRNIVTVFEFAEQDGVPYIVMEFLKGRSLSARMAADPPLSLEQKLDIMTELCSGLQFAHENGVVHRDVKPANVWLLDDGAVKLVDFGIAKISSSMTMHGEVLGSASYMSPEQIEGAPVTGRSDVFSAAVMLYEIIARRRPFEGDSPTTTMMQIVHRPPPPIESIVPDLPPELVRAIERGLEKNPDHRYQSAAEFGSELQLVRLTLTRDDPTILRVPVTPSAADFAESNLPLRAEPLPSRNATASQDVNPSPHRLLPWIVYGAAALTVVAAIGFWMISSSGWLESGAKGGPPKGAEVLTKDDGSGLKPPPTPPTVQSLRVDSKPQDARISVGGVATGQSTPAEIKVAAGDSIRLEKRGFETREAVISPSDLQSQSVLYELRQAEGPRLEVQITGSYPFEVYDGPKKLFDADTAHKLQAREGQILTLKSDRYFLNRPVRVEARGGRALPIVAPETGDIVFVGNESCVVFVDGKRADYVMRQLTVAAGEHRFEFRCSDQARVPPITLKIAPGDNPARSVR